MIHYVLVCAGHADGGGAIEARQTFEKLLLLLLTERFWPHRLDDSAACRPERGDHALFCLATAHGPEIIGDAQVSTPSAPLTEQQLAECRLYLGPVLPPGREVLTHAMGLDRANVWEKPCTVGDEDSPLSFELARALGGVYETGAVRPISDNAYRWLASRQACAAEAAEPPPAVSAPPLSALPTTPAAGAPPPAHARSEPVDAARDFLSTHWGLVDFGEPLELVNGSASGSRMPTEAGAADFLCRSGRTGDLVAVLCVNGEPAERVRSQVAARLAWVRENLAQPGQRVRAMVVGTDPAAPVDALASDEVDVRRLQIVVAPPRPPALPPLPLRPATPETINLKHAVHQNGKAPLRPPQAPPPPDPAPADFATKCLRAAGRTRG